MSPSLLKAYIRNELEGMVKCNVVRGWNRETCLFLSLMSSCEFDIDEIQILIVVVVALAH